MTAQPAQPGAFSDELPKAPDHFAAGIEIYETPRMENEADLVGTVRGFLVKEGVGEDAIKACYDGNRHIKAAVDKNTVAQRHQINRFLNLSLNTSVKSSIGLRAELLPNGGVDKWLKVVEEKVIPFIAKERLLA